MFPNRTPRRDVTAWSETKWFGCWNADDGVGLFPDGASTSTFGALLLADGTVDPITEVKAPWLSSLLGAPETFDLAVTTESGRTAEWNVEVQHTLPATISELNDNANGLDWRAPGEPLFLAECPARFTSPAGVVGYGHLERSAKRSRVSPETLMISEF